MADDEPTVNGGAESKPNLSLELIVKDQQGAGVTPPPPFLSWQDGTLHAASFRPRVSTDTTPPLSHPPCVRRR